MDNAWRRWRALWAGRSDARPLAVFRIFWGMSATLVALTDGGRVGEFGAERFTVPAFASIQPLTAELFEQLRLSGLIGAILVVLGVLPRLGAAVVVASNGYVLCSDLLLFRNHVYLLCLLGVMLAVSPSGNALSVPALLGRERRRVVPRWSAQAVKGQILVVYAWASLNKLNGAFLSGWVLQGELPAALPKSPLGAVALEAGFLEPLLALSRDGTFTALLAWLIVIAESAVTLGLMSRRHRWSAALLGGVLHGGIALSMSVLSFSLLMLGSYPLFLWGRRAPRPLNGLLAAREPRS
jgi:vitamin K-dependent gamma-carboxylase